MLSEEQKKRKAENQKKHYYHNRERVLEQIKQYHLSDKGREAKKQANARRRNTDDHRKYHREYCRNKYHTDINYKIALNLRNRLNDAIKNKYKSGSAVKDLGCSIEEFKLYIESKFQPGMSWDNYGHGEGCWNFDHIEPLSMFNLSEKEQLQKACNYQNIRPLWALENYARGNRSWL